MSETIKSTLSPELMAEEYCKHLQGTVETALQVHFGKLTDGWLNQFADKVSTSPEKVSVGMNERSLSNHCLRFSQELQQSLALVGLNTDIQASTYLHDVPEHVYLTPENNPFDVIIDPTIGQFVVGHNHVFVGIRQQLRSLILSQAGHENPYTLRGYGSNDPGLLFEVMWGEHSKPLSNFTGRTSTVSTQEPDYSRLITNIDKKIDRSINKGTFYPLKTITPIFSYKK